MNILLLITRGEIGGAQVFVWNLAKALKDLGHAVTVGLNEESYLHEKLEKFGIKTVTFKWLKRTHNPFANLFFIFELVSMLNKDKFDVVHLNSSNAMFGAIAAHLSNNKPKTVFTVHGLSMLDNNYEAFSLTKNIYCYLFKLLLGFIDKAVFVCQSNFALAKELKIVRAGEVIYNGLDSSQVRFMARSQARLFLGDLLKDNLENKFLIGSIGRLVYPKNYEFFIKTVPEILGIRNDACCVIIGDGPEKENHRNLIRKLGLEKHIYLGGELQDAHQYLRAFDIFALPSRYEGLSITLIEALFAGLPILASNVGGNPELLDFSEDQLHVLNDKSDFLDKFTRISQNPQLYARLASQNRETAARFLLDRAAAQYLQVYQEESSLPHLSECPPVQSRLAHGRRLFRA